MAIRNDLNAEIKTDIINYNGASNGQAYFLLGETVLGDTPYRMYYYSSTSTASVDGENVLAATGMGSVGRFLKMSVQEISQIQSDYTQSNSGALDFIKNKPAPRSQSSASRSLNSAFQISSTRDTLVNYSIDVSTSATLLGGQTGTVFLEIADDSGFTTGVQEIGRFVNGNSVSLAIAITITQNVTGTLTGYVPASKYVRLRTVNTVGTPTFNYRSGQEVLL